MSEVKRARTDYTAAHIYEKGVELEDLVNGVRTGEISEQIVDEVLGMNGNSLSKAFLALYVKFPEKMMGAVKGMKTWCDYAEAVIFDGLLKMFDEPELITEVVVPQSPVEGEVTQPAVVDA